MTIDAYANRNPHTKCHSKPDADCYLDINAHAFVDPNVNTNLNC